jgi:hypothetical protein
MKMIAKFLFLLLINFSNISTAIFIYPLIYFIFGINEEPLKWCDFGFVFSIYEIGKFFGLFLWHFLSDKYSNIFLSTISLSFMCLINISFIFSFKIYHILILRFLSGFFNNIGIFSKDFYIQLGLKDIKIISFIISNICTIFSLIFPGLIGNTMIGKRNITNNIQNLFNITIIFALINLLSIIMNLILIFNNTLKFRKKEKHFLKISERLEKLEYRMNNKNKENSKTPPSSSHSNRKKGLKHSKKYLNLKVKNNKNDNKNSRRNININSYVEKVTSNRYLVNRKEDDSKLSKRSSLNLFSKSKNSETNGKEVNQSKVYKINYSKSKSNNFEKITKFYQLKYAFINKLIEIGDILSLIWTLIILHIEYKGNSLKISFVYAGIKIFGEIISFPINSIIIKNFPNDSNKKILRNIIIMNILLFLIQLISNISIFVYYYSLRKKLMVFMLYILTLIRNSFSVINTQLFQIYLAKLFNIYSENMITLKKYNRYIGCIIKGIIFFVGSYGYYLIYNLFFSREPLSKFFIKNSKLIFIIYFIVFPMLNNLVLIIICTFFI